MMADRLGEANAQTENGAGVEQLMNREIVQGE